MSRSAWHSFAVLAVFISVICSLESFKSLMTRNAMSTFSCQTNDRSIYPRWCMTDSSANQYYSSGKNFRRIFNGKSVTVQAKSSTSAPPLTAENDDEIYGEDMESDQMAEARETVTSAMKTGSLVDPYDRIRLQKSRNEPGSGRARFFTNLAVLSVLVGSVYFIGKAYYTRQEALVLAYGMEMADNFLNQQAMHTCHKDYKRRLGPGQFRDEMFGTFVVELAKKKPISCETIIAVDFMRKKFGFKEAKVAKILSIAGERVSRRQPGLRSKLLFYADKLTSGSSEAANKYLNQLRDLLAQSYGNGGNQIVAAAQSAITTQAVRESIQNGDFDSLPEGYQLLGISEDECREILDEFKEESASKTNYAEADAETDIMYAKLLKKADSTYGTEEPEEDTASSAHECSSCGYTLYVAKGREWKFFGDAFKCPECGASKDMFTTKHAGDSDE